MNKSTPANKNMPALNLNKVVTIEFGLGTNPVLKKSELKDSVSWIVNFCKWNMEGKLVLDKEVFHSEERAIDFYNYKTDYWKIARKLKPTYVANDEVSYASAIAYIDYIVDRVIEARNNRKK